MDTLKTFLRVLNPKIENTDPSNYPSPCFYCCSTLKVIPKSELSDTPRTSAPDPEFPHKIKSEGEKSRACYGNGQSSNKEGAPKKPEYLFNCGVCSFRTNNCFFYNRHCNSKHHVVMTKFKSEIVTTPEPSTVTAVAPDDSELNDSPVTDTVNDTPVTPTVLSTPQVETKRSNVANDKAGPAFCGPCGLGFSSPVAYNRHCRSQYHNAVIKETNPGAEGDIGSKNVKPDSTLNDDSPALPTRSSQREKRPRKRVIISDSEDDSSEDDIEEPTVISSDDVDDDDDDDEDYHPSHEFRTTTTNRRRTRNSKSFSGNVVKKTEEGQMKINPGFIKTDPSSIKFVAIAPKSNAPSVVKFVPVTTRPNGPTLIKYLPMKPNSIRTICSPDVIFRSPEGGSMKLTSEVSLVRNISGLSPSKPKNLQKSPVPHSPAVANHPVLRQISIINKSEGSENKSAKTYKCGTCGYQTTFSSSFNRHLHWRGHEAAPETEGPAAQLKTVEVEPTRSNPGADGNPRVTDSGMEGPSKLVPNPKAHKAKPTTSETGAQCDPGGSSPEPSSSRTPAGAELRKTSSAAEPHLSSSSKRKRSVQGSSEHHTKPEPPKVSPNPKHHRNSSGESAKRRETTPVSRRGGRPKDESEEDSPSSEGSNDMYHLKLIATAVLPEDAQQTSSAEPDIPIGCIFCDFKSDTVSGLASHMKMHVNGVL